MTRQLGGELHARVLVGARQGHEVLHGRVRAERAGAHELLHLTRQIDDEREPTAHPALALVEALRHLRRRHREAITQLAEEPALLERVLFCSAHHASEQQCLALVERPRDDGDGVVRKLRERAQALEAIDDDVLTDDDDRDLLTVL